MKYAKQVLLEELRVIEQAIKSSDWSEYKEALNVRKKKCNELKKAIEVIENIKNK